jgi:hypothetical protein
MSFLFELEVIECRGRDVDLRVAIVHPDVPCFSTSRNFGLQLMLAFGGDESPLSRELTGELGVTAWYEERESDFVAVSAHVRARLVGEAIQGRLLDREVLR